MRCKNIISLVYRYCDGELDCLTAKVVQEHIKSCPRCGKLYTQIKEGISFLEESLRLIEPSADLLERVLGAVRESSINNRVLQNGMSFYYDLRFPACYRGKELNAGNRALTITEWRELWFVISENSHNYYFNRTTGSEGRTISG